MPPKTMWGNPEQFIKNENGGWDSLGILEADTLPVVDKPESILLAKEFSRLRVSMTLCGASVETLSRVLGRRLPTIRFRKGIKPKPNRTRRKQRLTRLQRRRKRQGKARSRKRAKK